MRNKLIGILTAYTLLNNIYSYADDSYITIVNERPRDIIDVKEIIPEVQVDMRYYGSYNFIGKRVVGYDKPVCLLTKKAATALKSAENKLLAMGLTFKVYDCYRPQDAVDSFVVWAESVNDIKMKQAFYPKVDKKNLFKENYIAYQSGHSRGSTVDLTIVPVNSQIPSYPTNLKLNNCSLVVKNRPIDNSLDFGSGFDCLGEVSHPDYKGISPQARANRLLLRNLMNEAGFRGLDSEWWHFTLREEPYPDTFFNFPVDD
ncbi:MAG: D-alanyl-D-alanine dipeptidase [Neisseriales bacterium]|nr:MAG: D-alanyl-D-alanine dipeptidase [Neisseriales bacterium]